MAVTADLGALVITLRVTRPLTVRQHMGRAAQQVCLDVVGRVDPALATDLHATHQVKPYAVSGLLLPGSERPVQGDLAPGDDAWVRLVGLRADVVAALDTFAQRPPATLDFDRVPWQVVRATWTNHPWAGRASYAGLVQQCHAAAPPRAVRLTLATPTAFSSADLNIPLPDPLRVFDSLRQQWGALTPLPTAFALPDVLPEFVRHFVPLAEYCAHTEMLMLKAPEIGFCAEQVKFTIKRRVSVGRSLRKNKPDYARDLDTLNAQRDDLARAVALLADFAFYSGVGIKTTTGMGMARRI